MIRVGLWVFAAMVAASALGGRADFGGAPAARALQAWWTARQFESAALWEDLDGLERLGQELVAAGAGDAPLRFAMHRLGFQRTGESWALPPAQAQALAEHALAVLEAGVEDSSEPFELRLIQALILVNRESAAFTQIRSRVIEEWVAAGGGPHYPFTSPAQSYREALALPREERSTFLSERFRISYREDLDH